MPAGAGSCELPSLLRVIHNRMGEELFIASTQNFEDLDRWLVTLVAAGASSLQPGAAKSCARAIGGPLTRGGATGGISGLLLTSAGAAYVSGIKRSFFARPHHSLKTRAAR